MLWRGLHIVGPWQVLHADEFMRRTGKGQTACYRNLVFPTCKFDQRKDSMAAYEIRGWGPRPGCTRDGTVQLSGLLLAMCYATSTGL